MELDPRRTATEPNRRGFGPDLDLETVLPSVLQEAPTHRLIDRVEGPGLAQKRHRRGVRLVDPLQHLGWIALEPCHRCFHLLETRNVGAQSPSGGKQQPHPIAKGGCSPPPCGRDLTAPPPKPTSFVLLRLCQGGPRLRPRQLRCPCPNLGALEFVARGLRLGHRSGRLLGSLEHFEALPLESRSLRFDDGGLEQQPCTRRVVLGRFGLAASVCRLGLHPRSLGTRVQIRRFPAGHGDPLGPKDLVKVERGRRRYTAAEQEQDDVGSPHSPLARANALSATA